MSTVECALYMGVSKQTLDNLATRNSGPIYTIGEKRMRVYEKESVDRWVLKNPWIKENSKTRGSWRSNMRRAQEKRG